MTLDEVAGELYGLPPGEFVAARDERARKVRDGGDKALATAIGALRRPTVAAWAVNLLARAAREDVLALLEVGDALREAQRRLSGEQLRTLSTQRQQAVNGLTRKAAGLAAEHGQRLSESVLRDVGSTLQAALADPEVGAQVRSGTLTAAASYEGFGPAALVSVPAAPAEKPVARTATPRDSAPAAEPDPRAEARRDLERTLAELESARTAMAHAQSEHDRAATDLTRLESRITDLRAELTHAEEQRRFTAATERSARDALRRAEQTLEGLERRAEQARNRLTPS
ncbi:hypothetical protein OHB26_34325 [Nocardia sp. NBC_01503]|uniref:hypothetical protein n=1 Tax=Nocardia sp. NBC_01503 TaxID=2975997 RepID=UPI002E7B8B9F|nr:hypothetical protein [Nocardia sp. NBC_01503]WTL31920.1 hypothetical protein OHB26_34325 [Nocardia sp. NBC_01503]